jgi:hypothetical protein
MVVVRILMSKSGFEDEVLIKLIVGVVKLEAVKLVVQKINIKKTIIRILPKLIIPTFVDL